MKKVQLFLAIIFLLIIACNKGVQDDNTDVLDGQYVEKNNNGIITVIGNFNNGERDGQFMYFDTKGKLQTQ